MDKKEIRYGIVGIGKQGTLYTKIFTKLSGLVKGAKLTAVCDILPERRKKKTSKALKSLITIRICLRRDLSTSLWSKPRTISTRKSQSTR